jgi:hypothetical protein
MKAPWSVSMLNVGTVYFLDLFTILMDEMDPNLTVVGRWATLLTGGRLIRTHRSHGVVICHWALPSAYFTSALGGILITNKEVTSHQKHQKFLSVKRTEIRVTVMT